ncbi:MAG: adenosylcobinamide-GDP ribazoletransferase [Caldisphaera sp.]|uniref:adenosylcobinamide-GDP ribazoletransferase n=1 Tax=Caldisphaera sp. TaxID=2060322 RepID=UPI003D0E75BB
MSKKIVEDFLSLISFLTIIPTGYYNIEGASNALYLSPILGIIEGSIIGLIALLLKFNPLVNGSILIAIHIIITGGLNLDGFADYSDVIGSRKKGDDAIKILKDPRKGSFAIAFTATLIIIRFSLFSSIHNIFPIIFSYLSGLESAYIISYLSPIPNYQGLGSLFIKNSKNIRKITINLVIYFLILIALLLFTKIKFILLSQLSLLLIPIIINDAKKRIGFVNGDVIGFTIELVEVISLLISVII